MTDPRTSNPENSSGGALEMPLFPLHTVLFPGMKLPLQIFEPRYHVMIRRCLENDGRFGVALISEGREVGDTAQVWPVGTLVRIERIDELPDGRLAVVTHGLRRFEILDRLPDDPYPRALVRVLDDESVGPLNPIVVQEAQALLHDYLGVLAGRLGDDAAELVMPEDAAVIGYVAAAVLPCSLEEKQQLLQAPSPGERLLAAIPMLRQELRQPSWVSTNVRVVRPFKPSMDFSPN